MRRPLLAILVALLLAASAAPVAAAPSVPRSSLVVLVLVPRLTWDDVVSGRMPALARLAEDAAVGDVNPRSTSDGAGTPTSGGLAISAGAIVTEATMAVAPFGIDERPQMVSMVPGGGYALYLGLGQQREANAEMSPAVRLGALGEALRGNGGVVAAVGNADLPAELEEPTSTPWFVRRQRPAALAAMDLRGRVATGYIGVSSAEETRFAEAFRSAVETVGTKAVPGMVVVDVAEIERADAMEAGPGARAAALERTDRVVARIAEDLPAGSAMVLVSQVRPRRTDELRRRPTPGLSPIVVLGKGWRGTLSSATTHRPGLGALLDVPATVLATLGVSRPADMIGSPLVPDGSSASLASRLERLRGMDVAARSVETAKPWVLNTYITASALLFIACAVYLWLPRRPRALVPVLKGLLLLDLSVPAAALLMFLLDRHPDTPMRALGLFLGVTAVIWAVAVLLRRARRPAMSVMVLALLTAGVLLADQWLGAPLSFTGFFGYSPLLGARYYGVGNESASVLVGASLVGLALLFDAFAEAPWLPFARRWLLPLAGAAVVLTAVAPFLGANVGVVAWGLVAFAVAWMEMNGVPFTWKSGLVLLAIMTVLLVGFAALDMSGVLGFRTHLGRSLASAAEGGPGALWEIVARKAATNLRVLRYSKWSFLLVVILLLLAYARWRPQGEFARTLEESRHFSAALTAGIAGGLVGYFTEDSGIVIPALVMLFVGAGLVYLMLSRVEFGTTKPREEGSG